MHCICWNIQKVPSNLLSSKKTPAYGWVLLLDSESNLFSLSAIFCFSFKSVEPKRTNYNDFKTGISFNLTVQASCKYVRGKSQNILSCFKLHISYKILPIRNENKINLYCDVANIFLKKEFREINLIHYTRMLIFSIYVCIGPQNEKTHLHLTEQLSGQILGSIQVLRDLFIHSIWSLY